MSTIRTAIYDVISNVSNVGMVYDYERHSTDWAGFLALFKVKIGGVDQVRGWMIGYRGIPVSQAQTFIPGKTGTQRTHRFQIMGVMAVDDSVESEKIFAELAEDVCNALDDDETLHAKGGFPNAAPVTMGFDPTPFAGVLVHAAVIMIEVVEVI
jgi:hypothetical protein